jgi:hypothetical protein
MPNEKEVASSAAEKVRRYWKTPGVNKSQTQS